jgi:hypothetical protein
LIALAFNRALLPQGARLNPVLGSDIGHWDVGDMREVLPDAWSSVEAGHVTEAEFADFTFGNVVRMLTAGNPAFFSGTTIGDAAAMATDTVDRRSARAPHGS